MEESRSIFIYFWIFGLINNVLYVVILSAAVDLVGPTLPKSIVLLADILPSFAIKLLSPYFIHRIPYNYRIWSLILLSCTGMVLVSTGTLGVCILGIVLASLSSGFGEVTFLQLTHFYQHVSLNGWSSGTGGAGLLGSASYLLLTSVLKVSVSLSLLLFSILPFTFLLYFRLGASENYDNVEYQSVSIHGGESIMDASIENPDTDGNKVINTGNSLTGHAQQGRWETLVSHLHDTTKKLNSLVVPYMIPLSTVYLFEYLINQAVSPTLLFPLDEGHRHPFFFHKYRDIYVTYGTLYQLGVFISRSSANFIRLRKLYLLSILQGFNLLIAVAQSWFYVTHSVWLVMVLIFYEGLLGGASYVNTFMNIIEEVDPDKREFSLGAVSISDSFGTLLAAFFGILLEPKLCSHQIDTGRPWCSME